MIAYEQQERLPTVFIIPLIHIIMGLVLFIALLNGQQDLVVLILLVMSVVVGAVVWSRLSLSKITCAIKADNLKVFPGETITLTLSAQNAKFLPIWIRMFLPLNNAFHSMNDDPIFKAEGGLLWFQEAHFKKKITALGRGWHHLGPLCITAGDLLGFFPRQKKLPLSLWITVYPRIMPLKSFTLPMREFYGDPGPSNSLPDPIYLQGTRDYQHFRPARYIHWKASARLNRLQEKICEPSERQKVLLVIDVDRFAEKKAHENFECALEIAASLATRLEGQGCPVGLATNGYVAGGAPGLLPVAGGFDHLSEILEVLARLQMKSDGHLPSMLSSGLNLCRGVCCVYISFEKDNGINEIEDFFYRRNIPLTWLVNRPCACAKKTPRGNRCNLYYMDEIFFGQDRK